MVYLVGFCYKKVAAIGFAVIKFVCQQSVLSLHANTSLENIPILYLLLFNSTTEKMFLDRKDIRGDFAPPHYDPMLRLWY